MNFGDTALEIDPRAEFQAARVAGRQNLTEERSEIRIGARDSVIRVVQEIEAFGADLESDAVANHEAPVEGNVDDLISGAWNDVAARIAEGVGRGIAECGGVEPMIDASLTRRQADAWPGTTFGRLGVPELAMSAAK